ncbi:EpsG family protein [uncultured Flavobacterium sp.]|uniref:EpsG family protein n=1 Tax=uncultured Flavobacterium sp. TaxID=165435 RepID=UPI0030EF0318|tara:strand:- start:70756 stop:71868 length:1113 start_codon:yes stop_codon:yes gene_type:complete
MIRLIVIFIIIILAVLFSSDSIKGNYDKKKARYIFVVTILLILQSGLRNWAVGADTYQYYLIFESVKLDSWTEIINSLYAFEEKDPFYNLFQKVFQVFTDDFQWYLLFVAAIFMPALGYFIHKNTTRINQVLLAYVIYMGNFYGFFSITGIRQTLATAILFWSYKYIVERKIIYFLLFVFIASLFHISAFVFLPLYFISEFKKPKLLFRFAILGFPLFLVFKNQIAVFLVSFVEAEERFSVYTEQYETGGSIVLTALHVFLAVWAILVYKKMMTIAPSTFRMYNMFALALFFFPLQWVNPSAGRIAQYFTVIIMVWIPYLIDASSTNSSKTRELFYFIALIALIAVTLFAITPGEYSYFWEKMDLPDNYK